MINLELKMVLENLSDTIDACGLKVSDEQIFIQACTFLRTPGFVGETSGKKEVAQETKESKPKVKNPNAKPTEVQIDFLCKNDISHDADKITRGQASDLISKYIAEHPREKES